MDYEFLGGNLALDFTNTVHSHGTADPGDDLKTTADLVAVGSPGWTASGCGDPPTAERSRGRDAIPARLRAARVALRNLQPRSKGKKASAGCHSRNFRASTGMRSGTPNFTGWPITIG